MHPYRILLLAQFDMKHITAPALHHNAQPDAVATFDFKRQLYTAIALRVRRDMGELSFHPINRLIRNKFPVAARRVLAYLKN